MAARLIINADDFGLTKGVNRAVRELHHAGVLSSATLMANAQASDDAVAIALANPNLGVGAHVLFLDGVPVSPPGAIPSLLGEGRATFRSSLLDFAQAAARGQIREHEMELEATAQIQKLQRAGLTLTHVDTHKHTHILPAVVRAVLRAMETTGISRLRDPFEDRWSVSISRPGAKRRVQQELMNLFRRRFQKLTSHVVTPDAVLGIAATGGLNATILNNLLRHLPSTGAIELVCHPGYNDAALGAVRTRLRNSRDLERQSLLEVMPQILSVAGAPRLIHYGELRSAGPARE